MSNIRLTTIVPDPIGSGIITLPGALSALSFFGTSTVDASSPSSASMTLSGGLGISKSVAIGGNVSFSTSSFATISQSTLSSNDNSGIIITGGGALGATRGSSLELYGAQANSGIARLTTTGSFFLTTGSTNALVVSPTGVTTVTAPNASTSTTNAALVVSNGGVSIANTTDATGTTSGGSLTLGGGLAVGKSLFVGGQLTSTGSISNSSGIYVTNTANSTGLATGSLYTLGGASVSQSFYVGGVTSLTSLTVSGQATFSNATNFTYTASPIAFSGSMTVGQSLQVSGQLNTSSSATISGILSITNTTDSSGITNGSIVTSGGIGLAGSLRVGGSVYINSNISLLGATSAMSTAGTFVSTNTSDATALGVGAFVLNSGISIAQTARIGGNVFISGSSNFTGTALFSSVGTFSNGINITSTAASTAPTTGALTVSGGFGLLGAFFTSGVVCITNTTDASSVSSAALVVQNGGLGVARSVFIGTQLDVAGSSTLTGATNVSSLTASGIVSSTNTTVSVSPTTGALVISGGIGVGGSIQVGSNLSIQGNTALSGTVASSGVMTVTNATEATSLISGSIVTSGGIAIAKSLVTGINANIGGNMTVSGSFTSLNTSTSSSSTTGAAVISGGMGVGGSLNVGGLLNVNSATTFSSTLTSSGVSTFTNTTDATGTTTGSIVTGGGVATAKSLYVGTNLTVLGSANFSGAIFGGGILSISNTTDSTSYSNGSINTAGGLGVAKNVNINGNLTVSGNSSFIGSNQFTNTTDSVSPTTGSCTHSGGVGITKSLNVGGGISVGGSATISGALTNVAGSFVLNSQTITDSSGLLYVVSPAPTLRLAANAANKTSQYTNVMEMFSLGGAYTDTNYESLQITTTSTNTYSIISRSAGTGASRKLVLQTGINTGQLALNIDGTLSLGASTTDSTLPSNGTVVVSGGMGLQGSLSVGKVFRIFGSSSGVVSIASPSSVTSYSLTLPSSVSPAANYALASDQFGNLTWSQITVPNPSFATVSVTATTASTSLATGALIVAGGASVGKNLTVYGNINIASASGFTTITTPSTNSSPTFTLPSSVPSVAGQVLSSDASGNFSWVSLPSAGIPQQTSGANNVTTATNVTGLVMSSPQFSSYILVTVTNSTAANSTSSLYLTQGVQQPSGTWYLTSEIVSGPDPGIRFTILSSGQIQYTSPNISGWISTTFQFYASTVPLLSAASYPNLYITGTADSASTASGSLQVDGGLGVQKSIYVGTSLYLPGSTSTTNHIQVGNLADFNGSSFEIGVALASGSTHGPFGVMTGGGSSATLAFGVQPSGSTVVQNSASGVGCFHNFYPNGQTTNMWQIGAESGSNYPFHVYNQNGAGVYINTGSTSWTSSSDARLKKDIEEISQQTSLDMINKMNPVLFNWKEYETKTKHAGFIAQEVERIIPHLVDHGDEYLGITYTEIIPYLVGAVKQLSKLVCEQRKGCTCTINKE